jgi:hypothetical protein
LLSSFFTLSRISFRILRPVIKTFVTCQATLLEHVLAGGTYHGHKNKLMDVNLVGPAVIYRRRDQDAWNQDGDEAPVGWRGVEDKELVH